jgi:hypothetical protein
MGSMVVTCGEDGGCGISGYGTCGFSREGKDNGA